MRGITVKRAKGIGDVVQFSSVPENYFRATGERLIDVDRSWIFDFNPFVVRTGTPTKVIDLWNFSPMQFEWPLPAERMPIYLSNAEIWALRMGIWDPKLIRPRLYQFEDFPFAERKKILLHTDGRSHGTLPAYIVEHVIQKYGPTKELYIIGSPTETYGLPVIKTETLWDLAKELSEARMLIGSDSGPSWIAACYPDVIVKKVRMRPAAERYETWVPLSVKNHHAHWDDRAFQIFNPTDVDTGAFQSYRRM